MDEFALRLSVSDIHRLRDFETDTVEIMPLKGIPPLISPELLYALASMGHGDEIVLADSNFPSESIARANGARLILSDGLPIPKLLRQILKLFPLDQYVAQPVALMDRVDDDKQKGLEVPIWNEYKQIVGNNVEFEMVERFAFYERAKKCFAVVRTYQSVSTDSSSRNRERAV